jgi:hypothetical protein
MNMKVYRKLNERFGLPIGRYAGEPLVGVRDERMVEPCPHCGMLSVNGTCGCEHEHDVCEKCGMMPQNVESTCECGLMEGSSTCSQCGMSEATCECGMNENDMEEVAPPGHEKMVKGLKKADAVENPWAVAWAHYNKKHPGGHGKKHR